MKRLKKIKIYVVTYNEIILSVIFIVLLEYIRHITNNII